MKSLILSVFLIIGFTCNPTREERHIAVSDCGTTIESPYLADDLIFESSEQLTVALRFIQCKRIKNEATISAKELQSVVNGLNTMYDQTRIKFVMIEYVLEKPDPNIDMREYRNKILSYKRNHPEEIPAIDIFIYPTNFEYYPGVALAIKSDGMAIQKKSLTTNTLTHEIGHCLGLHHTHQGNGEGYNEGDFICDTPNTGIITDLIDGNCSYDHKPNNVSDADMEIIIKNYMSYVNKDCRREFTKDQIDKMRYNLAKEPMLRNVLVF